MITVREQLGKEIREGGFKKAYHRLPHFMLHEAKEEICNKCFWSPATFASKINGRKLFRVFEIQQIELFFLSHGINAWTGEPITK